MGDPVGFVDPSGEFAFIPIIYGIITGGTALGAGWGIAYHYIWQKDYEARKKLIKNSKKRVDRWCREQGELSCACQEAREGHIKFILQNMKDLGISAGSLPHVGAGGPFAPDIYTPIIGETINAINQ